VFQFGEGVTLNEELYQKSTAGNTLPDGILTVIIPAGDKENSAGVYTRRGHSGEFFQGAKRLTIHTGTNLTIGAVATAEEQAEQTTKYENSTSSFLAKLIENATKKGQESSIDLDSGSLDYKLVFMSYQKGIDPKLSRIIFNNSEFKNNPVQDSDIEELLTQIARIEGGFSKEIRNSSGYTNEFISFVLRKTISSADKWQQAMENYGFSNNEIKQLKQQVIIKLDEHQEINEKKKISHKEAAKLARKYFPNENIYKVLAIMFGESGLDVTAGNKLADGRSHTGLMQISSLHRNVLIKNGIINANLDYRQQLMNPETNMQAAQFIFKKQGWKAWEASAKHKPKMYYLNLKEVSKWAI